ncbi:hypothetical protein Tco_0622787 [Tanacetum coccineum]
MTSSMVMRVDDVINGDESRSGPNTMKPMTKCLIVASMIGSSGLLGNSWPYLDMLPLEWLSEAGNYITTGSGIGRRLFSKPIGSEIFQIGVFFAFHKDMAAKKKIAIALAEV